MLTKNSNTICKSWTFQNQRFYFSTLNMSGLDSRHITGIFKKHSWNFISGFKMCLYPGTKIHSLSYFNANLIFLNHYFYLYLVTVHPMKKTCIVSTGI